MCGNPFAKPKIPLPTATPAAPEMAHTPDGGQQEARLDDRRRALYAAGLAGTNLTGPMGISGTAKTSFASLLGAAGG